LLTKRITSEDLASQHLDFGGHGCHTLPTAASPSRTSLTLLLGFGAEAPGSAMYGDLRECDVSMDGWPEKPAWTDGVVLDVLVAAVDARIGRAYPKVETID
jgi:hypothetical protein